MPTGIRQDAIAIPAHRPSDDTHCHGDGDTAGKRRSPIRQRGMAQMHSVALPPPWEGGVETAGEMPPHLCITAPGDKRAAIPITKEAVQGSQVCQQASEKRE